ncbi:uncharacterized protein LOC144342494 [Saccoglossus kowalevskii]
MPNAKVFSKFDATSGYWQLRLSEKSSKLTGGDTNLEGCNLELVQQEKFGREQLVEEFGSLEGFEVIVDDMLLYEDSNVQHDKCLAQFLRRVQGSWLKFNGPKCEIGIHEV